MELFIAQFHFIRPWWFIALIPTLLLCYLSVVNQQRQGQWFDYLPSHLADLLVEQGAKQRSNRQASLLLLLAWLVGIFALAGPSWQKIEQPLFKVKQAHIIVADMSLSMYATDALPNRLTRAKYKISDLLKVIREGETGLIAFAGDAFVISPMTSDVANLQNLLPALNPSIMPELGSRADLAIVQALELFEQTNYKQGQIYLFGDGIPNDQIRKIRQSLANSKFTLNIVGIGSEKGTPITLPNGQLLKDDQGNIVVPQLSRNTLRDLSQSLGGRYIDISNNNNDIKHITTGLNKHGQSEEVANQFGDRWHEMGPYLLLLLLPLVALKFRRTLNSVFLVVLVLAADVNTPLFATELTAEQAQPLVSQDTKQSQSSPGWWRDLWQTNDQQAHRAYTNNQHQQAASQFDDARWQGASLYQRGDYQEALDRFEQFNDGNALYNQGNALAQLGQYQQALARYSDALNQPVSNKQQIEDNIELVEQLLEQQKQDPKPEDQNKKDQDNQQDDGDKQEGQEDSADGQKPSDSQEPSDPNEPSDSQEPSDPQEPLDQQEPSDQQKQSQQQQDQQAKDQQEKAQQQKDQANDAQPSEEQQKKDRQQQQQAKALNETFNKDNLTKEQLSRLNQLLNKVNDDPSLLLKNKMTIESRKRMRQRINNKDNKNW